VKFEIDNFILFYLKHIIHMHIIYIRDSKENKKKKRSFALDTSYSKNLMIYTMSANKTLNIGNN
jgi:hypothetical protein